MNNSGPAYLSELLYVYTPPPTLRSSSDTRLLKIQQYTETQKSWLSCFNLALDHTFGIHSHKTLDTAQPCNFFKAKRLKTNINTQFLLH